MEYLMPILTWNLAAVVGMMVAGWVVSLLYRNVTVVDSLWGPGFVLIAWLTFAFSDGYSGRRRLIAVLVTVWGLRLCAHLSMRNWGKGEDPRYGDWRRKGGDKFWITSLLKVFILQAVFLWVISLVVQIGQLAPAPARYTWLDGLGLVVWAAGFFFESVADWQLAQFKRDPRNQGQVMNRGLWAYSRHPNYFGEFLVWWGLFLITLATPGSWWTAVSPVVITAVLLKMTGIPLMEKTIVETRPGYREYIQRTNAFFPWIPRGSKHEGADEHGG
jgi:steroid 5-alpha reductase family enzyme